MKDQFDISRRSGERDGAEGTGALEPTGAAGDGDVGPVLDRLLRGDVPARDEAVVVGQTVNVEPRLGAHHQLGDTGRTQADRAGARALVVVQVAPLVLTLGNEKGKQ